MAQTTVTVNAGTTSNAITVPARKILGIETDQPIIVYARGGSLLWRATAPKSVRSLVPPNDQITIQSTGATASVILNTEDT